MLDNGQKGLGNWLSLGCVPVCNAGTQAGSILFGGPSCSDLRIGGKNAKQIF
jgi:hypothetical protein